MKFTLLTPKKSLNKAFLNQRPTREEIDLFKNNLIRLLGKIDEIEREENQKTHVRDFLRDTYYKETNEINTKGTIDLVIHLGKSNKDNVGVIAEAKRPSNKNEMFSAENLNSKALCEIILYYMEERNTANNNELKNLLITNVYEWYIIDANHFDKHIYRNSKIKKLFEIYKNDKKDTPFFYDEISKIIPTIDVEIPCTFFDIRDYRKWLINDDKTDDKYLIPLLQILSPYHLLKVKFADDSNTLDNQFYKELLHIIGLEEVKDGSKLIIRRKKDGRNEASLLENTMEQLKMVGLHKITDRSNLGTNSEDNFFNVALELCITWMNRILFLKLLEGQLVSYHQGDKEFRFLNSDMIFDYDELSKLFHRVLAVDIPNRKPDIQTKYFRVPYLNSSLFEISELEDQTIKINELDNSLLLDLISNSVLKEQKKKGDKQTTLSYFFQFLNAYDFASEGSDDIKEDSKTIINASVLGKVFEKINGYKDGSIFTPGFITMYMCRQTIRMAVVQKFRDAYGWNVEQFDDLKNYLADHRSVKDLLEFNTLINSLRLCDPAVGSGHFLVSALNELIVIKYELGILIDEAGVRITGYELDVINDELIITDAVTVDPFKYIIVSGKPQSKEIQRLQKTLFHEKQTIIENCLFGVDINPNSVKICRLRLWIELLKSAYYRSTKSEGLTQTQTLNSSGELETLPNIDINIKCGNSLISRYALDTDIKKALKSSKWTIGNYRDAVKTYRNTKSKEVKREMEKLILSIKQDFSAEIRRNDPLKSKLDKLSHELYNRFTGNFMFEPEENYGKDNKFEKKKKAEQKKLEDEINAISTKMIEIKDNKIYENSFEWRFEFPEVLNDDGDFFGFDAVIGNPPYFQIRELGLLYQDGLKKSKFMEVAKGGRINLFQFFIGLGHDILKTNGFMSLIYQNSFLAEETTKSARKFMFENQNIISIDSFPERDNNIKRVFEEVKMSVCITLSRKIKLNDYSFPLNIWSEKEMQNSKVIILSKLEIEKLFPEDLIIPSIQEREKEILLKFLSTKNKTIFNVNSGELDMTQAKPFFTDNNSLPLVLKGAQIQRYHITNNVSQGKIEFLDETAYLVNNEKTGRLLDSEKTRIVMQRITGVDSKIRMIMTLVQPYVYCTNSTNYITGEESELKFILSVMNSKLYNFIFKKISTNTNVTATEIERIPIAKLSNPMPFLALVDKILELKKQDSSYDTTTLEAQIDQLVYKLYDLTDEEIRIVEGKENF